MFRNRLLPVIILISIFQVSCKKEISPESSVVINELMAVNTTIVTDQNGEYDDWIEMYNKSSVLLDLSGYYISDSKENTAKWEIPAGTTVPARGFLIIWADKDTTQAGLHSNFKLSSAGEKLYFVNPDQLIIDEVEYPSQTLELAYARNPDGTGLFIWQVPTYNKSNN
jgi:hypothetical protein